MDVGAHRHIAHRGPDDHGILIDGRAALGFRRLSILDLSEAGHQPMTSKDATLSIVFNGEICELEQHVRGETDASNLLFNVAQLDSWLEWHEAGWEPAAAQSLTSSSA